MYATSPRWRRRDARTADAQIPEGAGELLVDPVDERTGAVVKLPRELCLATSLGASGR